MGWVTLSEGAEEAEGGGGEERTWASDCVLCVVLPYREVRLLFDSSDIYWN